MGVRFQLSTGAQPNAVIASRSTRSDGIWNSELKNWR
jgi:hypothetical protein